MTEQDENVLLLAGALVDELLQLDDPQQMWFQAAAELNQAVVDAGVLWPKEYSPDPEAWQRFKLAVMVLLGIAQHTDAAGVVSAVNGFVESASSADEAVRINAFKELNASVAPFLYRNTPAGA